MVRKQIVVFDKSTGKILRRVRQGKNMRVRLRPLAPHEGVLRVAGHVTRGHHVQNGRIVKKQPDDRKGIGRVNVQIGKGT